MNEICNYVGIDVSKRKLDVVLRVGESMRHKVCENTRSGFAALVAWLDKHQAVPSQTHVCLEATGPYGEAVALALSEAGFRVSLINPAQVRGFAQTVLARNKTDRADAALLAHYCQMMRPAPWEAPSPAWRTLRGWVERLEALKAMRQQELNRREAYGAAGESQLLAAVGKHIAWLDEEIARLERDIDRHIDGHPELKEQAALMSSIPGVSTTTVAKVLAYAGDVRRFGMARSLAAFAGVCPRQKTSGSSVRGRTMMSRMGHPALRRALYMPALVARRHNPVLRAFADRLQQSGMAPKAVIGAVMRKLVHLIYGVSKSGQPFNPKFALDMQDGI